MDNRLSKDFEIPIENTYNESLEPVVLNYGIRTKKRPTMVIIIIVIFILAIASLPFILYFFVFRENEFSFKAIYNIIDNEQVIKLFNISISNIEEITIDGKKVDICNEYIFPSNGLHSVSVLIKSSEIKSLEKMFYKIEDLVSISFSSKFNFENIENMDRMFESCTKLTSIDF